MATGQCNCSGLFLPGRGGPVFLAKSPLNNFPLLQFCESDGLIPISWAVRAVEQIHLPSSQEEDGHNWRAASHSNGSRSRYEIRRRSIEATPSLGSHGTITIARRASPLYFILPSPETKSIARHIALPTILWPPCRASSHVRALLRRQCPPSIRLIFIP
jgi:hypothetical protein